MIDLSSETLVSLAEAAKTLPRRRAGKKPNVATLYRWTSEGVRGVHLEFLQVGATRCTSVEALSRFFAVLTEQAAGRPVTPPAKPHHRRKQIEAAEKKLSAAGI